MIFYKRKMKKILISFIIIFLIIGLFFTGLYFVYKSIVKNNLENRLEAVNNNWIELLQLQDEKNNLLKELINDSLFEIQYVDSLNMSLIEYTKNRREVKECNPKFVYEQYLSNKYMLPLIKFYLEGNQLIDSKAENIVESIQANIEETNKVIDKYNLNVRSYNTFYSTFPNFIMVKSFGFKKKDYFEIQFGVENTDPKRVKGERIKELKEIEKKYGLNNE